METSLDALAERVRAAAQAGSPLRIRGGGTKDFLAEPCEGEPLDTRGYAGVVAYEPSELFVTVRAGTPLAELESLLAGQGQCLPFEPPHFGVGATCGGMVPAGLSGPSRASVGPQRDYVLGIVMVNGRGETLTFGGQVMKNVAGYDVSRLMVGAQGALGLIAEVSLKVLPVPAAQATLAFELSQAEALRRINTWGGQPLPLNASTWQGDAGTGRLFVRLRGAQAAVEAACRTMGGERCAAEEEGALWTAWREQSGEWFASRGDRDLWRVSVPQTAAVLDLPDSPLIEWHGGQRWVRADGRDAGRIRDTAHRAGGHATLFRRGGRSDANVPRIAPLTAPLAHIHQELKRQFDPANLFNRGRVVALA